MPLGYQAERCNSKKSEDSWIFRDEESGNAAKNE
jgi:hypothetical protein